MKTRNVIYGPTDFNRKYLLQDSPTDKNPNKISKSKSSNKMSFDEFNSIITKMCLTSDNEGKAHSLGIDVLKFNMHGHDATTMLWKNILTEKGYDVLSWFLYEAGYLYKTIGAWKNDKKMYDKKGNEVCKDLRGVYDYLTKNKLFKK